ncbi:MAG: hypothetical protein H7Z14_10500 [Anaerolineae bacterium]|nr:hypothetical protein [Phycisphaerae bacterium]
MCAHTVNRIIRTTLLTLIFATSAATLRGDAPSSGQADRDGAIAAVGQNYGIRLRKLHLVRPDLIPYPLSLEVYC